jgi:glycosyltransferase involved in cell wall biosynthesis
MTGALVTHYYTTGNPEFVGKYLRGRLKSFVTIYHPLSFSNQSVSRVITHFRGKPVTRSRIIRPQMPEPVSYVLDLIISLYILVRWKHKVDVFVGADALNSLDGLIARLLGKAKYVIFYSVDLPLRRFRNPLLNHLYQQLNLLCAKKCDATWDLSPRMHIVRQAYARGGVVRYRRHLIVPATYEVQEMVPDENRRPYIFFVGHLRDGVDVSVVIRAMPSILREVPQTRLLIVGSGPDLPRLRNTVKECQLEGSITFYGRIEDDKEVDRIGATCTLGVAPYSPNPAGIPSAGDSGKLKQYLALGLPAVTTAVPFFAKEIEKHRAGVVVDFEEESFSTAILKLLKDPLLMEDYRRNAKQLAQRYSPDVVLGNAIEDTLLKDLDEVYNEFPQPQTSLR